jgi:hypothetical protein
MNRLDILKIINNKVYEGMYSYDDIIQDLDDSIDRINETLNSKFPYFSEVLTNDVSKFVHHDGLYAEVFTDRTAIQNFANGKLYHLTNTGKYYIFDVEAAYYVEEDSVRPSIQASATYLNTDYVSIDGSRWRAVANPINEYWSLLGESNPPVTSTECLTNPPEPGGASNGDLCIVSSTNLTYEYVVEPQTYSWVFIPNVAIDFTNASITLDITKYEVEVREIFPSKYIRSICINYVISELMRTEDEFGNLFTVSLSRFETGLDMMFRDYFDKVIDIYKDEEGGYVKFDELPDDEDEDTFINPYGVDV